MKSKQHIFIKTKEVVFKSAEKIKLGRAFWSVKLMAIDYLFLCPPGP